VRPPQRRSEVLDDAPVLSRLAGTVDRFVDLNDAAFDLSYGAFVLLVEATRQDDVSMPRRVVQKEVDGGVELELLEAARDERVVGKRDFRVEADRQQRLDLAAIDLPEQLVGVDASRHTPPCANPKRARRHLGQTSW
jgi:hypothetical protein